MRRFASGPRRFLLESMESRVLLSATPEIILDDRHVVANGTDGNDVIRIERVGTDDVLITINNSLSRRFDMDDVDDYLVNGGAGNDSITKVGNITGAAPFGLPAVTLRGGGGTDTLTGTDAVFGEGEFVRDPSGRLAIERKADAIVVHGTAGDDAIHLSAAANIDPIVQINASFRGYVRDNPTIEWEVRAADGDDTVTVASFFPSPVSVFGGNGNDTLTGSDGPESLFGEADDDTLIGNDGNDLLDGGPGTDRLDGGPGDDTLLNGEDNSTNPQIFIDANRTLIANGTADGDVMRLERVGADDVLVTVNSLVRRFDMDDIAAYVLDGLGENDEITKVGSYGSAPVTLRGGDGFNDTLRGTDATFADGENIFSPSGQRIASFFDSPFEFTVHGTAGNDVITISNRGAERFFQVNSTFAGVLALTNRANWYVDAEAGNDRINVGADTPGAIELFGDDGNDFFDVGAGSRVGAYGDAGDDTLLARGADFDGIAFDAGGGTDTIQFDRQSGLALDSSLYTDVENVTNARGTVSGNSLSNRIVADPNDTAGVVFRGRGGDDTLIGGAGPDELYGEDDDDTLVGNAGNDLLDGGPGVDSLDGGPGDDTLVNGETDTAPSFVIRDRVLFVNGTAAGETLGVVRTGTDDVRVSVSAVNRTFDMDDFDSIVMNGGAGNDTMTVGAGVADVTLNGEAGEDRLTGNELANGLFGGANNDNLVGNGGADFLAGEAGNDSLDGGSGDDRLHAGDGDDTITGGSGDDFMRGDDGLAPGNDTFFARDGQRDQLVDGDAGHDRAQVDGSDVLEEIEELLP